MASGKGSALNSPPKGGKNLCADYWGTPRNDGFIMMPNELETYREGGELFQFKGTNGFMLTFAMNSRDVASKGDAKSDASMGH
jgi:hypothetical protein